MIEANDSSSVTTLIAATVLTSTVATASVTDLRSRLIPDRLTVPAAVCGLGLAAVVGGILGLAIAALSGILLALPLLAVALARPCGMGMGDVKLVAVIGIYLGTSGWTALLAALALAALTGAMISLSTRTRPGRTFLPLAPFLALGAVPVAWLPLLGPG